MGRTAKAAGLAFNRVFGSEKEKRKKRKKEKRKKKNSRKSPRKIRTTKWNKRKQQLNEPTNLLPILKFRVIDTPSHAKTFH